jgi:hypothetical protein
MLALCSQIRLDTGDLSTDGRRGTVTYRRKKRNKSLRLHNNVHLDHASPAAVGQAKKPRTPSRQPAGCGHDGRNPPRAVQYSPVPAFSGRTLCAIISQL